MRQAAPPTLRHVLRHVLRPTMRHNLYACALFALALLPLGGCGAADGLADLGLGTVFVANQTNLGLAPLTVTQFFIAPVGDTNPGANRLSQPLDPGDIQTLGLFFEGTYNAVAVLESGLNVIFPPREVRAGEPTTFVIPPAVGSPASWALGRPPAATPCPLGRPPAATKRGHRGTGRMGA